MYGNELCRISKKVFLSESILDSYQERILEKFDVKKKDWSDIKAVQLKDGEFIECVKEGAVS